MRFKCYRRHAHPKPSQAQPSPAQPQPCHGKCHAHKMWERGGHFHFMTTFASKFFRNHRMLLRVCGWVQRFISNDFDETVVSSGCQPQSPLCHCLPPSANSLCLRVCAVIWTDLIPTHTHDVWVCVLPIKRRLLIRRAEAKVKKK